MKQLAVITGAASGLGLEFSILCAADDYDLLMVDIDSEKLEDSAAKLRNNNSIEINTLACDLGEPKAATKIFEKLKGRTPHILINNAGFGLRGEFINTSIEKETSMIGLHVTTPTILSKVVLKGMKERGAGKIMNIASMSALTPGPMMAVYYATKAYMVSLSTALATELKGSGITVTSVCPGLVDTGFAKGAAERSGMPQIKQGALGSSRESIAYLSYRAMQKGKVCYIPGTKNRLLAFLLWIFPRTFTASIIKRSMKALEEK